ncbi:MAG: hypothetical protein HFG25_03230 [Lachnospiraceae bacterium]|nr:hypothetical protein [Lachnospiraceae bacterium]
MEKESLLNTLDKATANAVDVYFDLYTTYFEDGKEPEEALRTILEYPNEIGDTKDKNPQSISLQDETKLFFSLEELICGIAERLAEMNLPQDEYYKKLYRNVFNSDNELYPQSKEEKVIALKILSERAVAVPYFPIEEMDKISKEEFEQTVQDLRPSIQEAFCMLQRRFSNMPERIAQILRIADKITDKREKIIFWTVIINKMRSVNKNRE